MKEIIVYYNRGYISPLRYDFIKIPSKEAKPTGRYMLKDGRMFIEVEENYEKRVKEPRFLFPDKYYYKQINNIVWVPEEYFRFTENEIFECGNNN